MHFSIGLKHKQSGRTHETLIKDTPSGNTGVLLSDSTVVMIFGGKDILLDAMDAWAKETGLDAAGMEVEHFGAYGTKAGYDVLGLDYNGQLFRKMVGGVNEVDADYAARWELVSRTLNPSYGGLSDFCGLMNTCRSLEIVEAKADPVTALKNLVEAVQSNDGIDDALTAANQALKQHGVELDTPAAPRI